MNASTIFSLFAFLIYFSIPAFGSDNLINFSWVSIEDHGDKPGIEMRVKHDAAGGLSVELWIFTTDENGKLKERAKMPVRIDKSTESVIDYTLLQPISKQQSFQMVFPDGLSRDKERAVVKFKETKTERTYIFTKEK